MSIIGLLGDTHGNTSWVKHAIETFAKNDIKTIIQVGDFGIYQSHSGMSFTHSINVALDQHGMDMIVVPGNHEDWDYIEELYIHDDGWARLGHNIRVAPRGHRWEMEGKTFVGLGGAPSVDRAYRVDMMQRYPKQKLWWEQEAITQADVDKQLEDGHADVMVCHDAPWGVPGIENKIATNPFGFDTNDLSYALEGRQRMLHALRAVQPKLFLHGHYHFLVDETYDVPYESSDDSTEFTTHILGLNCDGNDFSLGQLDLDTLEAHAWNRGRYYY